MAITYLGSAIWSYNLFNTGRHFIYYRSGNDYYICLPGCSSCHFKTKSDQSYFAAAVLIISIAQQLVPNTNGHNELDLAQLITSSSLLNNTPPGSSDALLREKLTSEAVGFLKSHVYFVFIHSYFVFRTSYFLLPFQRTFFMSI